MKICVFMLFLACALPTVLGGMGCETKPRQPADCAIYGQVVDADTAVPIDSAQVFLSSFLEIWGVPGNSTRNLIGVTDAHGNFSIFPVSCKAVHVVEVEKEGYVSAADTVRGGDKLLFALEPVVP